MLASENGIGGMLVNWSGSELAMFAELALIAALARSLRSLLGLQVLDVRSGKLDNDGATALALNIGGASSLTQLNLLACSIDVHVICFDLIGQSGRVQ